MQGGIKRKWLNATLHFGSFINEQKTNIMETHGFGTIARALAIVLLEGALFIFGLPAYIFIAPAKLPASGVKDQGAIQSYRLRRTVTLSVLLGTLGLWALYAAFGALGLSLFPGRGHAFVATWDFNTPTEYVYDSSKIQIVDGTVIFKAQKTATTSTAPASLPASEPTPAVPTPLLTPTPEITPSPILQIDTGSSSGTQVQVTPTPAPAPQPAPTPTPTPAPTQTPSTPAPPPTPAPTPAPAPSATTNTNTTTTTNTSGLLNYLHSPSLRAPTLRSERGNLRDFFISSARAQSLTCEATIQPLAPLIVTPLKNWTGFTEIAEKNNGEISYQLSADTGLTWLYWNGSAWSAASPLNYNSASEIDTHIADFPTTTGSIIFKAHLQSDCAIDMKLLTVTVDYDRPAEGFTLLAADPTITFTDSLGAPITTSRDGIYINTLTVPTAYLELSGNLDLTGQIFGSTLGNAWMSLAGPALQSATDIELLLPKTRNSATVSVCPGALAAVSILPTCLNKVQLNSGNTSANGYTLVKLDDAGYWHIKVQLGANIAFGAQEVAPEIVAVPAPSSTCGTILNGTALNPALLSAQVLPTDDYIVTGEVTLSSAKEVAVVFRYKNSGHFGKLIFSNGTVQLKGVLDGTLVNLSGLTQNIPLTTELNASYRFKIKVLGDQIYAKVWLQSQAEPETWMLTAADSRFLTGGISVSAKDTTTALSTFFSALSVSSCVNDTSLLPAPSVSAPTAPTTSSPLPAGEGGQGPGEGAVTTPTIETPSTPATPAETPIVETPRTTPAIEAPATTTPTTPAAEAPNTITISVDVTPAPISTPVTPAVTTPEASPTPVIIATVPDVATVTLNPQTNVVAVTITDSVTGATTVVADPVPLIPQVTHEVTATYDGNSVDLYVDGAIVQTTPATITLPANITAEVTVVSSAIASNGSVTAEVSNAVEIASAYLASKNSAPVLALVSAAQQTDDGSVDIQYTLRDQESNFISLAQYKFSLTGAFHGEEQSMTPANNDQDQDHSGTSDLVSSVQGTPHTFIWNPVADLPFGYEGNVYIRLQPDDGIEKGRAAVSNAFPIDTKAPIITDLHAQQIIQSDGVKIAYHLSDSTSIKDVVITFSTDNGVNWRHLTSMPAQQGDASETWSAKDFPANGEFSNYNGDVLFKISAHDEYGNNGTATTTVALDTKAPFGLANLKGSASDADSILWTWSPVAAETNFAGYTLWYGTDKAAVEAHDTKSGAKKIDVKTDADFKIMETDKKLVTGLKSDTAYYAQISATDAFGNTTVGITAMFSTTAAGTPALSPEITETPTPPAPVRGGGGIGIAPAPSSVPTFPTASSPLTLSEPATPSLTNGERQQLTIPLPAGEDVRSGPAGGGQAGEGTIPSTSSAQIAQTASSPTPLTPATLGPAATASLKLAEILSRTKESPILAVPVISAVVQSTVGNRIELTGKSIPRAKVALFIHSDQVVFYTTEADEQGAWHFTHLQDEITLAPGEHTIYAVTYDPGSGVKSKPTPIKSFFVTQNRAAIILSYFDLWTTLLTLAVVLTALTLFAVRRYLVGSK